MRRLSTHIGSHRTDSKADSAEGMSTGNLVCGLLSALAIFATLGVIAASSASADGTLIVTKGGDRSASSNVSGATTYAGPVAGAVFEHTTGDPTSPATVWTAFPATAANGQASAVLPAGIRYVREKTGGTGFANFGPVQNLSFNGSQPYVARVNVVNNQTTYAFPHSNTSGTPANWTPTNTGNASNNGSPFLNVRDNDTLPPGCGTNILLVLDRSGSIDPFKDSYEAAAKEFVNQLNGTPTQIGITSFNSSVNSYQPATGDSDFYNSPLDLSVAGSAATLNSTIEDIYAAPEDLTNWDGALQAAAQAKSFTANGTTGQTTNPDMVVFITDGNPTTSEVSTSGSNEDLINLTSGMASANLVKNQTGRVGKKLKMLAIGVGNGVTIDNLKVVSGPVEGVDGDYAAPTIPELQSFLSELAASQCGARVFVRKRITGDNANKPNWFYTATDPRPGKVPTYQDGNRATHSSGAPPVIETGAFFNQLPSTPTTVNVNEDAAGQPLASFDLTSVVCRKGSYDSGTLVNGQQTGLNYSLPVNRGDAIYCTYTNTPRTTLSVSKTPDNGTINAGEDAEFTIQVSNTGSATAINAALNDALPAPGVGGWTISQQPAGGNCNVVANNMSCTLGDLAPGASVTIKVKTGTSFASCGVYDNPTATASAANASNVSNGGKITCQKPNLSVNKTGNGPINAGEDVEFTVAVGNAGPGVAKAVTLADTLPGGVAGAWTVSQQPTGGNCLIVGNNLTCTFGDIASGVTRTLKVKAPTSNANCTTYDNNATASSTNHPNVSDPATVTCNKPTLGTLKTSVQATISAGDTASFSITVSNTGPGVAKAVTLNDPLPGGLAWVEDPNNPNCQIVANVLSCNFGDMAANTSHTVTVKAPTDFQSCTTIDNTATASSTNAPNASDDATITCNKPNLSVVKTGNGPVSAGADVEFTIQVSNAGPGTARSVALNDPLPAGTAAAWTISSQPGGNPCSIAANTLTCNFGDLAPGASVTVKVKAPTSNAACTTYDNTATATSTNSPNATDDASIVCNKPNLSVVKTGNGPVNAGEDIEYTIQVSNAGPGTAGSVSLTDPLPSGTAGAWTVSLQPGGNPCSIAANTLTCNFGDLASGASVTVKVKASTSHQNCTTYDNTATASSTNTPNAADGAVITCNKPNISVLKTGNGPVSAGEDVEFTIQVSNAGPGTAKAVSLSDPLPAGSAGPWAISSQPGGNPCTIVANTLSCNFGDLASGASVTVKVKASTSNQNCTTYDNTATASSTNHPNVADGAVITCNKPNISVVKTGNGPVSAGEDVEFTIQVSNAGPGTAKAVTLSDPLPSGTAAAWTISSQPGSNPCSIVLDTLTCNFGDLASGASVTVKVKASTSDDSCKIYDNTATASSSNAPNASDDASIACNKAGLGVLKTAVQGTINAGDTASFSITVSNTGDGTAKDVTLSDPLPGGLTWVEDPDNPDCTITAGTLNCDFGDLASGASVTVTVKAPTDFQNCATLDNTATASATNAPDASDDATINCQKPNLSVVKTGNGPVNAGEDVEFTIQVNNAGPGTAKSVSLSDPLPAGTAGAWTISSQPGGNPCSIVAGTLNCSFGDLASGASVTVKVKAPTNNQNCTIYDNTATASSTNAPNVVDDAVITCNKPNLSVVKTGNGPVNAGEDVEFTVEVKNAGPGVAKAVTLSDSLPGGLAWTENPDNPDCQIVASTLSCNFGDMAADTTETVKVKAATSPQNCTTYDNTATASSSNAPNASDDASITCNKAGLGVLKTAVQGTINAGDTASFSITVSNTGDGVAKDVTLSDPLPGGLAWVEDPNNPDCTITAGTLNCDFGDLASGASVTVTVKAPTDFQNCSTLDNTATASSTNAPDATDDATINCQKPNLTVTKTGNGPVNAGEDVVFTVEVKNAGPGVAKAVTLNDPLPGGLSWVEDPNNPDCQIVAATLTCNFGDMAADTTETVKVKATTSTQNCTTYDNTATAKSTNAPDATDSDSVECRQPGLGVLKTAVQGTINAGDTASFSITVSNTGDGTAKDVTLSDPLPGGLTWVEDPDNPDCTITAGTLNCDFGDLASGASVTVTVKAPTDFQSCTTLDNTATASSTNAPDATDDATINCQKPNLSVVKTGNGPVNAGEDVEFTIQVSNAGPGVAKAVKLSDPLPTGTAAAWAISSQPGGNPCTITAGTLNCDFGDLASGSSVNVKVKAATSDENCTTYDNTATASSSNAPNASDDALITCNKAGLGVLKTAVQGTINAGDTASFSITVSNTGDGTAKDVTLSDPLPGGLTWVEDPDNPDCTITAGTLNCDFGDLASGASVTVTVKAPTDFQSCTTLDNTATASSTNAPNAVDDAVITCNKPNLSVVKTGNGPVNAGEDVEFTVEVKNAGPGTAKSVTLSDPLPGGLAWTESPDNPDCAIVAATLTCDFGDMAADTTETVKVKAATSFENCTTYDNTATAKSTNAPDASDDASVTCDKSDLGVLKTAVQGTISAGDTASFSITVSNTGDGTAKDVTLSDQLPGGLTWVEDPDNPDCTITAGTLNCDFGDLASGASVTVTVKAPTDFENCATLDNTATASATNAPDASDDASINCQKPDLTVTKTGNGPVNAGENVEFTINVNNAGPGTAKAVKLSDPLPSGTAAAWTISSQPGGDPCAIVGGTLTCDFGDLASGASATVKVSASTSSEACTTYDNTATATSTNSPNATDDASITCNKPGLGTLKTAVQGTINAGEDAQFSIEVSNVGPGTAKSVTLSDPLPSGVSGTWSIVSQPGGNPCSITAGTLNCDFGDLASGASVTVTVSAATDFESCTTLDNTATASATNAPDASDDATINCQKPNLSVTKTGNGPVSAGDDVEFSIEVKNAGPGTAKSVKLSDPLPTGTAAAWTISSQPAGDPCSITAGTLSCDFGDVTAGTTLIVKIKAPTSGEDCQVYDNTATASAANAPDASGGDSVTCDKPGLGTLKTAVQGTINAGEDAQFSIAVSNTGLGTAKGVTLSDPLPTGVTGSWSIVSQPGGNPCSITAGTLNCDFGDLAPGASVTVTVKAATDFESCTTLDNTATASATNAPDASDDASIDCQKPNLTVTKTGNGTVNAGEDVGFSIVVNNAGPGTAKAVTLSDPLPTGVSGSWSIVSQPGGNPCSITAGTLDCDFGDLASGASVTVTVKAATDSDNCATLNNTATASATNAPDASDEASVGCQKPNLSVTKTGNGPIESTEDAEFTIVVANAGPGEAVGVTLTDPLPAGTAGPWTIGSQPVGDPCSITDGTLNCAFGNIAASDSRTITISAPTNAENCETFNNLASVDSSNTNPITGTGSVDCIPVCPNLQNLTSGRVRTSATPTGLCPEPNLQLRKTANKKKVFPGDDVRYGIHIRNVKKGSIARNLKICDRLPSQMSVIRKGSGFFENGKLCWFIKALPYSKKWRTFHYVARVDEDANPGSKLKNVVTVQNKRATRTVLVKRPQEVAAAKRTPVTG